MRNTLILFILLVMTACGDDEDAIDYTAQNDQEIQDYMATNNVAALKTPSGLYYSIETLGNGAQPRSTDNVRVAYRGHYTNGSIFDQSDTEGISFNLQGVIEGWTEGITYFNEGGTGKLLVPAHLGYGSNDRGDIPGGSVLIFDIHLIAIE